MVDSLLMLTKRNISDFIYIYLTYIFPPQTAGYPEVDTVTCIFILNFMLSEVVPMGIN